MTEHKFTDEEIIKALECCANGECDECIYYDCSPCKEYLNNAALDLINRQKEEIEQLKHKYELSEAEREANIKGFADEITKANSECEKWYHDYHVIKEELKQEKAYHKETEKLADRYLLALHTAKSTIAREIFEEIETLLCRSVYPRVNANGTITPITSKDWHIRCDDYDAIKKKYTEE